MRGILAAVLILIASSALAWTHGGGGGGGGGAACPYGTGATDGCTAAIAATVQHTDFFTNYALQMGQTYTMPVAGYISGGNLVVTTFTGTAHLTSIIGNETVTCGSGCSGIPTGIFINSGTGTTGTYGLANATGVTVGSVGSPVNINLIVRPPWDVAGVDYAVGVQSGVSLADPATITVCPATPVCRDDSGNTHHVAYVQGANPTVSGYDFTLEGSWSLVIAGTADYYGTGVSLTSAASGTVSIQNNKFTNGANYQTGGDLSSSFCAGGCGAISQTNGTSTSGVTHINVDYNTFDMGAGEGGNAGTTNFIAGNICSDSNSVLGRYPANVNPSFKYNAFINSNNRCNFAYGADLYFNYFEGVNYNTPAHGEWTTFNEINANVAEIPSGASWTTSSTTIALSSSCPSIFVGEGVSDATVTSGSSYIGSVSSCAGTTLTLQANALIAGANGDHIAFEACSGNCPSITVNMDYNTFLQPTTFAGGITGLVYLSSGLGGGNWGTVNTNNNTAAENAEAVSLTAKGAGTACTADQTATCTITWSLGQANQNFTGEPIDESPYTTGSAKLGTNITSSPACVGGPTGSCGSGQWYYYGPNSPPIAATPTSTIYLPASAAGVFTNGGRAGDWSQVAWTCNNNWLDTAGTYNAANSNYLNVCFNNLGTFSHSGNMNILKDTAYP